MDEKNTVKSINGIPVEDTEAREAAASKIGKAELGAAVEEALTQAKESGDFKGDKGEPGYTPQKGVDYFDGAKGDPGDDYILTEADKTEIAEEAADIVDDALSEVIGDPDGAVPAVPGYMALGMAGAAVGMVARIAAVDADGKPTAWEPVEMASGGGSGGAGEWKKIGTFTAADNINPWIIDKDENGNAFSCTEFRIIAKLCWFHNSANNTCITKIGLIGDDGKDYIMLIQNLGGGTFAVVKGDDVSSVNANFKNPSVNDITTHGGRIVGYFHNENTNNAGDTVAGSIMNNRGIPHTANAFTGIKVMVGYATNLVMAGSQLEIWGR